MGTEDYSVCHNRVNLSSSRYPISGVINYNVTSLSDFLLIITGRYALHENPCSEILKKTPAHDHIISSHHLFTSL